LNRAQRGTLLGLRRDGVISEEVFEMLTAEIDAELSEGTPSLPESGETRTQFVEVTIPPESQAVGRTIVELEIPRSAVLVTIQRGDEIIIPRGDTRIAAGDVVTVLCEREFAAEVRELLLSGVETHIDQ
jgi:trk system potassium uptake protein TrkA